MTAPRDTVRRKVSSFSDRLPVPPRWVRYTLVSVLVVVSCLWFGITTASTEASLGPHNARYEVTTSSLVTVDLGPLGTVQLESPLPLMLGVRVTIEEIPADLTAVDSATTLNALAGDVDGYLQFFSGPDATISYVTRALLTDAAWRAAGALAAILVVGCAGYLALGATRRRELGEPLARASVVVAGGVAVALVATTLVVTDRASTALDRVDAQASPVFDGTALEGARITGRLSGVIDTYGGQLVNVYRSNESFYETADRNLETAWADRQALDEQRTSLLWDNGVSGRAELLADSAGDDAGEADASVTPSDGTPSDGTPSDGASSDAASADASSPAEGDGTDEPGDEPTQTPSTSDPDDVVTMLMVSDLHCNTGMSPLITTAATLSEASVIINGGDSTINGTAVERFCVDSFIGAAPDGVDWVQADGNHDSSITSDQARSAGATVLDGSVVDIDGVRFLGDSDPKETRIGQGSTSVAGESYEEAGNRLRDVACSEDDPADILLIHTPGVGEPVMASGCVPIQLSGHIHHRSGPLQFGKGVRYVSSTTAGAASGQPTIGPLNGTAEMTVFRFDRERRVMLDYQVIAVQPDRSVQVGERMTFPPIPGGASGGSGGTAVDGSSDAPTDAPTDVSTLAPSDTPTAPAADPGAETPEEAAGEVDTTG